MNLANGIDDDDDHRHDHDDDDEDDSEEESSSDDEWASLSNMIWLACTGSLICQ